MTKQDILNTTGLSEEEFYQRYPDQEAFCSEYPEMCPDMMDDEDVSNEYVVESDYDDSLYEAKDGVETTAPYTDYNQYKNAMQTYGAESNKAATYNNFQNDLYNQSGKTRGFSETTSQLGDMFNTLSPEQQDALAQKYGAQFITNTPSANRRNYVNSMEMTVPGKGTGYYSFPTNDVVYGSKDLERPNYELSAMKMTPYKMPATPSVKNSFQPAQIINNIGASYKDPASLNASNGNLPIPKHSLNSTMKKVGTTNQPFVTSTPSYSSIVDLLKARKLDSSFTNRKKLAEEAGIKNYTGSASQNMDLINRMDNFNPYSTEMELGGENMFVNGGLVKYQKKGEVKQNPPKEFTDFKKFQKAERLYKDSLDTYNNSIIRRAEVIQNYKNAKNIKELIEANKKTKAKYPVNENISIKDKSEIIFKRKLPDGTTANLISSRHFKKPVQPVVFQSAPTHPIEHLERLEMMSPSLNGSNIQIQGQTIPMKPMKLKQRGTIPFYGPGNTLIGFTDENRQFYPGEYTGAPHNQINLQDKYLLDHPELLKEYLKKRDNYKVDNFKVGGVNIHPAMRTNFKQGGLVKYQDNGEVKQKQFKAYTDRKMYEQDKGLKMSYGDLMRYVEEPEMIQVDGIRSQYEPEYNTIFYNDPRSIPDELAHAVQRANGDIGYSVPPNYNSIMRVPPEMKNVYPISRKNIDPDLVNANAGEYNAIREKNSPNNSGSSLSNTYQNSYVKRYPADYKIAGEEFLKKLNDENIYMIPGSGEFEAHQLIEPSLREHYFNYNIPQYKQGGYYGMDGRLHRAKGSGTYVTNGGYYFNVGGAATDPPTAGSAAAAGAATIYDNMPNEDGTFNVNNDYDYYGGYNEDDAEDYGGFQTQNERALKRQARRQERRNTQYETPDLGGLDESQYEEQPKEEVTAEPFDASNYSSAIDPSTGFTKWSKNNQALTNIKKQDPALWGHLKDEGKGARWETGQTDFQKFGRAAGKVGATLDAAINVAGAFGNLLNNRNEQRNLNNAAINQGSTASIYTNPQGASKGDYGQTGSSYGMTNPTSIGARSFKGMYGKYGMQVPKYDIGGGFSNLFTSAQSVIPITKPMNLIPSGGSFTDSNKFNPFQNNMPIVESTGVYRDNRAVNQTADNNTVTTLDPDFALQSMAQFESGSKPGQAKVGMPTSLVGEDGKKASASGTFQITTPTLKDIFNNDKDISSKYGSFNKFKSAFDTDSKVEYEAARSLMARHIKNYGIYALGAWYYPEFARRAAAGDKSVFDIVPRRDFGNRVKWGDDFNKKLNAYNKLAGTNYTLNTTFNAPKTAGTSAVIPTAKPAVSNYSPSNTNFSLKGLIDFAKTNKWVVTSTSGGRHNPGSRHKKFRAIDVSVKNKTPQQILDFMKLARSQGYRVLDERVRPKGQKEWHGPHLHLDFKKGGQFGGQVMEMDEDEITQFLKAGGQLEFLD